MKYLTLTSIIFILAINYLHPAWLDNVPNRLTQPDGTVIDVFYSGDEHHNWPHDKDYYTMIIDEKTGYVCWAISQNGDLVSTGNPVNLYTPQSLNLKPRENISPERYKQKRQRIEDSLRNPPTRTPTLGTINELVVFVRFSDDSAFTQQTSYYDAMFNDTGEGVDSLKQYYWDASYNQLIVNSPFFPIALSAMVNSYQDIYPRSYFQPYNSSTNPNGYQGGDDGDERKAREHLLLKRASEYVANQIPLDLDIDSDDDGYVDNVNFVVKGSEGAWSSLLWPHRWVLYTEIASIHGKRVWDYNFNIENHMNYSGVSVLAHEFGHSLGAPDYYRYTYDGTPVGPWDIMASNTTPPQSMSAYTKYYYMGWVPEIPTVTYDDYYTLYPNSTNRLQHSLKILSPNSSTEYFVVEYRSKLTGLIDSAIPGSGLLVWRINSNEAGDGNSQGPPDELYIYRPGGTTNNDGSINQAYYSTQAGRTAINNTTNPSPFLSNGQQGGLNISNIGSADEAITFFVNVGNPYKPPTNLTAEVVENTVVLSWSAPTDSSPTNYYIYRDQSLLDTIPVSETTYNDQTVITGSRYTYTVRSVYPAGVSNDSNSAQIAVISPSTGFTSSFEDGTTDGWVIVNGSQINKWIVGTATASTSNRSIYISNNNSSNTYNNSAASIVHFFRDIKYTSFSGNTLSFDFKGVAEVGYDFMRVYLCETNYVPVPGSITAGSLLGEYCNNVTWTPKTINLPNQPIDTTKRVVFTWINDTNTGLQPPPAVDNIVFSRGPNPPVFSIDLSSHDFEEIAIGSVSLPQTFTITNTGEDNLLIDTITLSGINESDFSLITDGLPWSINEGVEQTFTASFSPTSTGEKTANINITHNADGSPATVTLLGTGTTPVFCIDPTSMDFADVMIGTTSLPQTFTITNTGAAILNITTISLSGTDEGDFTLTAVDLPWAINSENDKEFTVSFLPTTTGEKSANINISHNASDSPSTVSLSGNGTALEFTINPIMKDFGNIVLGDTSLPQTFTITNTGTVTLAIDTITLSGVDEEDFTLTTESLPWTINIGDYEEFTVSFSPSSTGTKTANLSISHNESSSPITIALYGTGTAPEFSISPTSKNFENIIVGDTSQPQTFTITNSGTATLTINNFSLSGTNESEFTLIVPEVLIIDAEDNLEFTVSFSPTSTGEKTASISITHNASNVATTISLSGTGTAPVFNINPTSYIFTDTTIDTVSPAHTFSISNTGTANLSINTISLSGTHASEFTLTATDLPWTIIAGEDRSFNVSFAPITTGAKTASINITHNANGSPHTVALSGTGSPVSDFDETSLPAVTALSGNYPNPFNPETTIRFSLARPNKVTISIYSINGQLVKSLVNGSYDIGNHSVIWNGLDDIGHPVSSGVYFYRMTTSEYTAVRKMLLLK